MACHDLTSMLAPSPFPPSRPTADTGSSAPASLIHQFTDPQLVVEMASVLGVALILAAMIAYHPSLRAKATTRADVEQPKTLIMYGLVGALVGHIVMLNEMMALVVFGIGGLMRFRTDVGEAKDTGRVILVAIVGICCGVQSFLIATLATVVGWILVWLLERQVVGSLDVMHIEPEQIRDAAAAYRRLLTEAGCHIIGERKSPNPKKPAISMVFRVPASLNREQLIEQAARLPPELRGTVDWILS